MLIRLDQPDCDIKESERNKQHDKAKITLCRMKLKIGEDPKQRISLLSKRMNERMILLGIRTHIHQSWNLILYRTKVISSLLTHD